ncbi:MAG: DUF4453 domain-containing protein [Pseudomonadota bacterium]
MFRFFLTLFLLPAIGGPTPAHAGYCEDLWFTRNAVMDRAGICFGSPLGQAVFDNTGCIGASVQPSPAFAQLIAQFNQAEQIAGCRVDTSQTFLDLKDLSIRQRLVTLPIPEDRGQGFGCIGWRGAALPLRDTNAQQGAVIGQIDPGDSVYFFHIPADGWSYVTTEGAGRVGLKSGGWMPAGFDSQSMCAQQAG